jgi:hypothetical protein
MNGKRPSQRAQDGVDSVYPVILTGKPHHMTRKKQRIAWQLGYLKGFEEARKLKLYQHMGKNDDN